MNQNAALHQFAVPGDQATGDRDPFRLVYLDTPELRIGNVIGVYGYTAALVHYYRCTSL